MSLVTGALGVGKEGAGGAEEEEAGLPGAVVQVVHCPSLAAQLTSQSPWGYTDTGMVSQQMAVTCLRKGPFLVYPKPSPGLTAMPGRQSVGPSLPRISAPHSQLLSTAPHL